MHIGRYTAICRQDDEDRSITSTLIDIAEPTSLR
jgi:hypothetical protein